MGKRHRTTSRGRTITTSRYGQIYTARNLRIGIHCFIADVFRCCRCVHDLRIYVAAADIYRSGCCPREIVTVLSGL